MVDESTGRTREERAAQRELQDLREEFPLDSTHPSGVDLRWEFPRKFYEADHNYRLFDSQMNALCVPPDVQAELRAYIVGEKEYLEKLVGEDLILKIEDFSLPVECLGEKVQKLQFEVMNLTLEGKTQEAAKVAEEAAILFGYGARLSLGYLKAPETERMPTGLPEEKVPTKSPAR